MSTDTWRDPEGFGRNIEVSPDVWSAKGPDDEDHSIHCSFIYLRGILPCDCDATRKRFGVDHTGQQTRWYPRWMRWQTVRSSGLRHQRPIEWPVTGPDGEPWVPGVDFNDGRSE